jgi:hypothetical protein
MIIFLTSCGSSSRKGVEFLHAGGATDRDYIEHLASLGQKYLASDETHEIKLRLDSIQFLEQIYERIITNNELLFTPEFKPQFHIILTKTPFIFSLPRSQFFISSGLIEKYLKSEELFVAALTLEILKSERNIYEKKIIIPLGWYSTGDMIQITRIKQDNKYQLNEWTYVVLKRAGFDPTAYLNWIQIQNRNTLDFSPYLGDASGISKEEHLFKNFMTKQGIMGVDKKMNEANSSKAFYKLLNNIEKNK